jgi:hypothetical protein
MTEDRVLMGGGTDGAEGGANTHTLVTANLPVHSHTFSDTSTSALTTHTHSFSDETDSALTTHTHGVGTLATAIDGAHVHNLEYNQFDVTEGTGYWLAQRTSDVGTPNAGTSTSATHDHAISGSTAASTSLAHTHTASGTTGTANLAHTHDVSGTTSEVGSGTAVDHTPKHLRVNWAIKT